ncbi:MAG: DUF488 domain-containing protein [Ktedonobacteraceae bacterium]
MSNIPIYTIGYGNRSMQEFIRLLKQYGISYLIDIRSRPYSRFNPEFSKETLAMRLKQSGVRYVFMGDTLGGRPDDSTCYIDGQVDYTQVRVKPFYQQGIERIRTAWEKQLRVALMCSEAKPYECHRGKLIGNTLLEHEIEVAHIDEKGKIMEQREINRKLTGGQNEQPLLFDGEQPWILNEKISRSRKKYAPKGERCYLQLSGWYL